MKVLAATSPGAPLLRAVELVRSKGGGAPQAAAFAPGALYVPVDAVDDAFLTLDDRARRARKKSIPEERLAQAARRQVASLLDLAQEGWTREGITAFGTFTGFGRPAVGLAAGDVRLLAVATLVAFCWPDHGFADQTGFLTWLADVDTVTPFHVRWAGRELELRFRSPVPSPSALAAELCRASDALEMVVLPRGVAERRGPTVADLALQLERTRTVTLWWD